MLNRGDQLDNWEIIGKIGEGGMGEVYRARNMVISDVYAAVKISRPTDFKQARARFEREVKALLRLQHPSVVRIQGVGEDPVRGILWFAMDLVDGEPLEDVLDRGTMPLDTCLPLFIALCEGLSHAHERGVAHRDLKPANIIVRRTGEPVLVDFGISAAVDASKLTRTGMVVGTPQYLPPEALDGKLTEPKLGDIYALGQMLIEAIDGEPAFPFNPEMTSTQNALRIMHSKVARGPLSPKTDVPPDLRALIEAATQPDPDQRLQDVDELGDGLRSVAGLGGAAPARRNPTLAPSTPAGGNAMPTMEFGADGASGSEGDGHDEDEEGSGRGWLALGAGAMVLVVLGGVLLGGGVLAAGVAWYVWSTGEGAAQVASADPGSKARSARTPDPDDTGEIDEIDEPDEPDEPDGTRPPRDRSQPSGGIASTAPVDPAPDDPTPRPDGAPDGSTREHTGTPSEAPPPDEGAPPDEPAPDDGTPDDGATDDGAPDDGAPDATAPDEPSPGEGPADDGVAASEPDPAPEPEPVAPAVVRIRPDWRTAVGISKGMGDGAIERLLGPSSSGSDRYCGGGESARSYKGGAVIVCKAFIGGAKRVYVDASARGVAGLPSDSKLKVLGVDRDTLKALIGNPQMDRADDLRYNHGQTRVYMSRDTVRGFLTIL